MKRRTYHIFAFLMVMTCMLLGTLTFQKPQEALADSDMIQVNGKYSLTATKLVTKCKLETADSTLKKKTRTYIVTSKTEIQKVNEKDFSKTTLKGKKRKAMIKKLNKKNLTIQFKAKKGKVSLIWII